MRWAGHVANVVDKKVGKTRGKETTWKITWCRWQDDVKIDLQ
jgi:hypothetical protein